MFENLFSIDPDRVIRWMTPSFLRGLRMAALLQSFAAGMRHIKQHLLVFRSQKQYELLFSSRRIYLEHYLNDRFDPYSRGIRVENAHFINAGYRYNTIENRLQYAYNRPEGQSPRYLRNRSEIADNPRFMVVLPAYINLTDVLELKIRAAVDKYNIATIAYQIT